MKMISFDDTDYNSPNLEQMNLRAKCVIIYYIYCRDYDYFTA